MTELNCALCYDTFEGVARIIAKRDYQKTRRVAPTLPAFLASDEGSEALRLGGGAVGVDAEADAMGADDAAIPIFAAASCAF